MWGNFQNMWVVLSSSKQMIGWYLAASYSSCLAHNPLTILTTIVYSVSLWHSSLLNLFWPNMASLRFQISETPKYLSLSILTNSLTPLSNQSFLVAAWEPFILPQWFFFTFSRVLGVGGGLVHSICLSVIVLRYLTSQFSKKKKNRRQFY